MEGAKGCGAFILAIVISVACLCVFVFAMTVDMQFMSQDVYAYAICLMAFSIAFDVILRVESCCRNVFVVGGIAVAWAVYTCVGIGFLAEYGLNGEGLYEEFSEEFAAYPTGADYTPIAVTDFEKTNECCFGPSYKCHLSMSSNIYGSTNYGKEWYEIVTDCNDKVKKYLQDWSLMLGGGCGGVIAIGGFIETVLYVVELVNMIRNPGAEAGPEAKSSSDGEGESSKDEKKHEKKHGKKHGRRHKKHDDSDKDDSSSSSS